MPGHVLVVDDDALFRRVAERSLTRSGFRVATADSSGRAMLLAATHLFDTAILDYFLGAGESGCDLIAPLRARHPTIRIAILSGLGALPDVIRRAHRAGANTVASKTTIDWPALAACDPGVTDPAAPLRPVVDLRALRRDVIHGALFVHRGNVTTAARALGMTRSSLQRVLRKMPLPIVDDEDAATPDRSGK
ncbi:MAG TPA: response regulator [Kofleriaceae bacterium]|nr:response regulator [Kofleriaceae bacterium]